MPNTFLEWLLLNEIGHVSLQQERMLPFPDQRGRMKLYPIHMVDPMFETYQPIGHREDEHGEIRNYDWKDMINMNPGGQRPGIGWEGLIPFTENTFFGVAPREIYAHVGSRRNLIRVPDNWYAHAFFIDARGNASYYAPERIFQTAQAS